MQVIDSYKEKCQRDSAGVTVQCLDWSLDSGLESAGVAEEEYL